MGRDARERLAFARAQSPRAQKHGPKPAPDAARVDAADGDHVGEAGRAQRGPARLLLDARRLAREPERHPAPRVAHVLRLRRRSDPPDCLRGEPCLHPIPDDDLVHAEVRHVRCVVRVRSDADTVREHRASRLGDPGEPIALGPLDAVRGLDQRDEVPCHAPARVGFYDGRAGHSASSVTPSPPLRHRRRGESRRSRRAQTREREPRRRRPSLHPCVPGDAAWRERRT